MHPSPSSGSTYTTNVFEIGKYPTTIVKAETQKCTTKSAQGTTASVPPPPKPLLIATPTEAGNYPVILFLHGYLFNNYFYSQLLLHIASHGFILIAPQLYSVAGPDASGEVKSAAAITNWLPEGLTSLLPSQVHPNLAKLALAGHSRGGKAAFALALRKCDTHLKLKYSALLGIDPVDGMDIGKQTPPPVLTYTPRSFDLNMAVMVVGSGLGEVRRNPLFPPCAPKGVNHEDFYNECREPACYFVAKDYGHVDMLDDETKGVRGKVTHCLCKNGKAREPMRRFVGGISVAFLKGYLDGEFGDLVAIKQRHELVPLEIQRVEFLDESLPSS